MRADLEQRLRDAAPSPARPLDVDATVASGLRARRRRTVVRSATAVVASLVVLGGAAMIGNSLWDDEVRINGSMPPTSPGGGGGADDGASDATRDEPPVDGEPAPAAPAPAAALDVDEVARELDVADALTPGVPAVADEAAAHLDVLLEWGPAMAIHACMEELGHDAGPLLSLPDAEIELVPDDRDPAFEVEQDGAHGSARGRARMEPPDQLTSPEFRDAWRACEQDLEEGPQERADELVAQLRTDWDGVADEVERDPRVVEASQQLARCVRDEDLVAADTPDGVATLEHLDDPASGWAGSPGALERLYAEDGAIAQHCGSELIETRAQLLRERRPAFLDEHRTAVEELEAWRDETFRP